MRLMPLAEECCSLEYLQTVSSTVFFLFFFFFCILFSLLFFIVIIIAIVCNFIAEFYWSNAAFNAAVLFMILHEKCAYIFFLFAILHHFRCHLSWKLFVVHNITIYYKMVFQSVGDFFLSLFSAVLLPQGTGYWSSERFWFD